MFLDLAGKDEQEEIHLDQVMELYRDLGDLVWPYIAVLVNFGQGDKVSIIRGLN
jgi:hypothetical protein